MTDEDAGRPYLMVKYGDEAPRRFDVARHGTRLGRASANDIHFADGALSRNHCMFEHDGDGICVIDLGSANGTKVNGETVGDGKRRLEPGDVVTAGGVEIVVAKDEKTMVAPPRDPAPAADIGPLFDDSADASGGAAPPAETGAQSPLKTALWVLAALLAAAVVALLLAPNGGPDRRRGGGAEGASPAPEADKRLVALEYERIEADSTHILRYFAALGADGKLRVEFDDARPGGDRNVRKNGDERLKEASRRRLEELFASKEWLALDQRYSGASAELENRLRRISAKSVWRDKAKEVVFENGQEPPAALAEISEALESLVNAELGIDQMALIPKEDLEKRARGGEELGDKMWDERDVETPNLWHCVAHYREARQYWRAAGSDQESLDRVNGKLSEAELELKRRHDAARSDAAVANNNRDWERAMESLRRICLMIPERTDPRHRDANAQLLELEQRMRELRRKGTVPRKGGGRSR